MRKTWVGAAAGLLLIAGCGPRVVGGATETAVTSAAATETAVIPAAATGTETEMVSMDATPGTQPPAMVPGSTITTAAPPTTSPPEAGASTTTSTIATDPPVDPDELEEALAGLDDLLAGFESELGGVNLNETEGDLP